MVTWEEVELLSLSDGGMQNGVFYEVSRKGSGVPIINVGDMYEQVPIMSDRLELFDATDDEIKRFAVNDGDLFFTRSSVVPSGIAFCNWYKKTNHKPVVFDSHVIRFKTDTTKVVPMFLYLQCISLKARKFFVSNAKTATMTTIDQTIMGKCPIDLPPIPEQRAIAAVLSDTDAYIATFEKLLAKKRAVKQSTMQELLTGKRRLLGFEGEWNTLKIGEFTSVASGGTPSTFRTEYWGGNIPWMNSGELNLKRVYSVEGRITKLGLNNSSATEVPRYSVLIGLAGQGKTRGTVALNYIDLCTNQSIAAVFPNKTVYCSEYLYQNLDSRYEELRELSTGGGARGGLNLTILRNLDVPFPTLAEQSAIATILSDMDAEIDALTAKLNKARQIKQGMMQELLTGRIRMIREDADDGEN